jgi:molecular chaperone DnaK
MATPGARPPSRKLSAASRGGVVGRVRVWWAEGAAPQPHALREVTARGMLVVTRAAPPLGREVRFVLSLHKAGSATDIAQGTARIVWIAPSIGVGLEFLDVRLDDARLAQLTPQRHASRHLSQRARSRRVDAHPGSLGIDFGTSALRMAVLARDKPRILELRDDSTALAASVTLDDQGTLVAGREAAQLRLLTPERSLYGIKRLLGHAYDAHVRADLSSHYGFALAETPEHRWGAQVGGRVIAVEEAARVLLAQTKRDGELRLGAVLTGAVIGVPCHFDAAQRGALARAANACGFSDARLVTDPIAAAVGYAAGRNVTQTLLVVDVGGGQVQAALVQLRDHDVALLGAAGSSRRGGMDCDAHMATQLLMEFRAKHDFDGPISAQAATRLLLAAEDAKRALSFSQTHELSLPSFVQHRGKSVALRQTVSVRAAQDACTPLMQEILSTIDEALARSGLLQDEVDELLLLGGVTHAPWLRSRIAEHVGRQPCKRVQAEQAVVRGLAWLGDPAATEAITVLETLTESVRIAAGTTLFEVLPVGTAWPVKRPLKLASGGEKSTRVHVFSGHGTQPGECQYLATFKLDTSVDRAPNATYLLKLELTEDGLLRAKARHEPSGAEVPCALDEAMSLAEVLRDTAAV